MEDKVVWIDESDQPLGYISKTEAHQKGLLHRAISVFIFNSDGEMLLQRRAIDKYHSGGLWTNSCCTHPLPEESYLAAANRRLQQEMGLTADLKPLMELIYYADLDHGMSEHELDHVYIGVSNMTPLIDSNEVCDYQYIRWDKLHLSILETPEIYTVWFLKIFEIAQQKLRSFAENSQPPLSASQGLEQLP